MTLNQFVHIGIYVLHNTTFKTGLGREKNIADVSHVLDTAPSHDFHRLQANLWISTAGTSTTSILLLHSTLTS
jgi:hypothetical protein